MQKVKDVCRYIDYLKSDVGLSLSLHTLHMEKLISQSELLRYNLHENSYCIFLKSHPEVWEHCISRQNKLLPRLHQGSFCGSCFAGVMEYIYPILRDETPIGFISVGSAQAPDGEERLQAVCHRYQIDYYKLSEIYHTLPKELPPREKIDTLIAPLVDMLRLRYYWEEKADLPKPGFFSELLHFIHINHTRKITLDELSRQFYCSKSYISHHFKQQFGVNVNEYINRLRIKDAVALLRHSELSITEISIATGFSDSNYFSNCFKRAIGLSPREFRKQL